MKSSMRAISPQFRVFRLPLVENNRAKDSSLYLNCYSIFSIIDWLEDLGLNTLWGNTKRFWMVQYQVL